MPQKTKTSSQNANVVVSSSTDLKLYRRPKVITLLVVVLVVVLGLVYVICPKDRINEKQFNAKVNAYTQSNDYQGLINYVNSLPKNEQTDSELASAYSEQGNYTAALKVNQEIIAKYGNSMNMASAAAAAAQSAHNNKLALIYYRQALAYNKALKYYPMQESDEQALTNSITYLESDK